MKKIKSILLLTSFYETLPADDLVAQQRFRVFRITTVFSLMVFSVAILQTVMAGVSQLSLAYLMTILFIAIFINYFGLGVHKNAKAAYIILLFLTFTVLHVITYGTGGIRNSGIFYLASIILIASMLLGKKGCKIMAGISITHVIYFYFVSMYTNWADYSLIGNGPGLIEFDFLITGVLSILLLTSQSTAIEKSNNAIINDIKLKRDQLAAKNLELLNTQKDLELKNLELLQKNRELEQFAFVSSHDLQEPLRTMSDFAGLLKRRYQGRLDDNANKYLDFITQSSERMKTLIKDLLQYSQIGSEKGNEQVNCAAVLGEVITDIGKIIEETKAEITIESLPVIIANPTAIKQLFQNLLLNAIKFRNHGSIPEIKITGKKADPFWEFSIADNGIGIEQQHVNKIFDIFQRLHTRSEYSGSGIGLSHCKKIVDMHGGRIWVESAPGVGSTFYFTIHPPKGE